MRLPQHEAPVIFETRGISRIRHLPRVRALHVEWLDFSADVGFATTMVEGLALARQLELITWIADTANTTGSMSLASQAFLHELHASGTGSQSSLRAIVTVKALHLLAFLSNQWWHREVSSAGHYLVESVDDLDTAVALAGRVAGELELAHR